MKVRTKVKMIMVLMTGFFFLMIVLSSICLFFSEMTFNHRRTVIAGIVTIVSAVAFMITGVLVLLIEKAE